MTESQKPHTTPGTEVFEWRDILTGESTVFDVAVLRALCEAVTFPGKVELSPQYAEALPDIYDCNLERAAALPPEALAVPPIFLATEKDGQFVLADGTHRVYRLCAIEGRTAIQAYILSWEIAVELASVRPVAGTALRLGTRDGRPYDPAEHDRRAAATWDKLWGAKREGGR